MAVNPAASLLSPGPVERWFVEQSLDQRLDVEPGSPDDEGQVPALANIRDRLGGLEGESPGAVALAG